MQEYHKHGDAILEVWIDPEDIIRITLGGNLTEENMNDIDSWSDAVKQAMVEVSGRKPGQVYTLIGTSQVGEVDTCFVTTLRELMSFNKQYATLTAVIGAPYFAQIIVELMLVATKRKNMKLFPTEEEGMSWLRKGDTSLPED